MTPDFQREEALFNAASELESPAERAAYLARECAGEDGLRKRIEEMLASDAPAAEFFQVPKPGFEGQAPVPEPPQLGPSTPVVGYGTEAIGRYRLLEKLGEGGFGTVYVAEQTQPVRRRVALKVIKAGMDTREVIARFNTERQALALMDHPNIAKVLDAGSTSADRPYFVMELVLGTRITEYCELERLDIPQRLALFISVCHAVQHAHQKGVIHRDLKPSNILVVLQDGVPVPKVIDFGIAKATEQGLTNGTVYTQLHQLIGTPAYMSPEQAEMSGLDVDTRSDIYSLGVLLYELLTGETPFDDKELLALGIDGMRKTIREKLPPRPSTKLTQTLVAAAVSTRTSASGLAVPAHEEGSADSPRRLRKEQIAQVKGDLDWIVMKCLEKDRNRRYETANGLARDLQRHLHNETVTAGPPSKIYALKKFIARNKWPVLLNATVAVLTVAGLIGTSLGLRRATAARLQADRNAARANQLADAAKTAEAAARLAETNALRQAYSASMLSASDAFDRAQIDSARHYLDKAPTGLRGWEWRHFSSRLDLTFRTLNYPRTSWSKLLVMPDGQSYYDLFGSPPGGIYRRNIETGELLAKLPTPRQYFSSQLLAGGKQLFAHILNGPSGEIELWDLARGTLLWSQPLAGGCAATPDGSRVASIEDGHIHILDPVSRLTRQSKATASDSSALCFQPGGQRLAFSPSFGKVALLDTDSLQIEATFEAHRNSVQSLAFSPDGRWLASGSLDSTIRITDVGVHPPVAVATLRGHTGLVLALCFSPDGSLLASSDSDRTLRLWDMQTHSSRAVLKTEGFDPSFLPDGRTLINGHPNGVRFWDVPSLEACVLRGHRGNVYPVLLSPDGATIYSGGWDGFVGHPGSLRFWDAATGEEIAATGVAGEYVRAATLSTDGSRLAVSVQAANDTFSRIDILDTATGTRVASIAELGENLTSVRLDSLAFDPAAQRLVWIDPNSGGIARLADARTGTLQKSRKLLGDTVPSTPSHVAWSPDGATIAVYNGGAPTVELLDAHSLEPVRRWPHGSALREDRGLPIRSLSFSPDSRRIVTTSEDGIAKVWDAATGALLHDLVGHASRVLCAAYSPDGKRIASGGDDHNVRIWDAETFDQVARLAGHEVWVYSLAWRADSQQLVSGSGDNTVRIWDTQPLTERVQARREREAILARVEPLVQHLFAELGDAHKVVERVKADPSLGTRARQVALQVTLRTSLARQHTAKP